MANHKGATKVGGRAKGTPNRQTKALKDMILGALDSAGGEEYLLTQAKEDPKTFLQLIGKVLPLQVTGDSTNPLVIKSINYKDYE